MTKEEKAAYMQRYNKEYYAKHSERLKRYSSDYRKKNPRKASDVKSRWYSNIKSDPEAYKALLKRCSENHLKRKFGITLAEYGVMCKRQNGECGLCGKKRKLVIDHDHTTGHVRGLLCRPCNGFLGLIGDGHGGIDKLTKYFGQGNG